MLKARIAVFVSGGGTNLQALLDAEKEGKLPSGEIALVVSNKPDVYALERASAAGVEGVVLHKKVLGQEAFEKQLIALLEEKKIDRKTICYFVLEPIDQPGSRYYVPAENQAALSKLRPLSTKEELQSLLTSPLAENVWIADENRRKQYYRELVSSVNLKVMIDMIRCLRLHRRQQMEQGRKFHQCDENFLRDAQKILSTEIAMVMEIPDDQVEAYLQTVFE